MIEEAIRADYEYRRAEAYKTQLLKHSIPLPPIESLEKITKEWRRKINDKQETRG